MNVRSYDWLPPEVFARRRSDCHLELKPSTFPTVGIMSVLDNGVCLATGVTGVTRLIETGMLTGVTPVTPTFGEPTETRTVPEIVPFGRFVGSAVTFRATPSGGYVPDEGATDSHGLSTVALKGSVCPANPGTKTCCVTGCLLSTGIATFGWKTPNGRTGINKGRNA